MQDHAFNLIMNQQIEKCQKMLEVKADEYAADDDRLHNFKVAARLQGITQQEALAGMMAKHTISIYDMCRSQVVSDTELWEEKITDHINYLILLKAIVLEPFQIDRISSSVEAR
jgi:hypothetical protein